MTLVFDKESEARAATTKVVPPAPDDKLAAGRQLLRDSGMNEAALAAIEAANAVIDRLYRK